MKYAVIQSGGKQYRVSEGDVIEVDRLSLVKNGEVDFTNVLLLHASDQVKIGTPRVKNVHVIGKVLGQIKGEKIRVSKFKAKARYRRTTGFRASLTRVQIVKI